MSHLVVCPVCDGGGVTTHTAGGSTLRVPCTVCEHQGWLPRELGLPRVPRARYPEERDD